MLQAAGLLMLAFGVIAIVRAETLVEIFDYFPRLTEHASRAGFDLPSTAQDSAVFMIVLGGIVGLVGVLGCVGACYNVKWMLSVVSVHYFWRHVHDTSLSDISSAFSIGHVTCVSRLLAVSNCMVLTSQSRC